MTHDQVETFTLGDRIAVMRAGVLQQIGSREDIYGRPDNPFVAGFIGSPAMNFLPGRVEGTRLRTPIGEIEVPDRLRPWLDSARAAARASVIVGIRPEHFEDAMLVDDRSDGHTFKATPPPAVALGAVIQDHGSADAGRSRDGVPMLARLGRPSRVRQGDELWFDIDHHSGRNLLRPAPSGRAVYQPSAYRRRGAAGWRPWSAPEGVRLVSRWGSGTGAGARHGRLGSRLGRPQMRPRGVGHKLVLVGEKETGER